MKYTFIKENGQQLTVEIPEKIIAQHKKNLGCTTKEAIDLYLFDEGHISDPTVEELTQKAKENKNNLGAGKGKTRKAPVRKPDYVKRAIIEDVASNLKGLSVEVEDELIEVASMNVTNIERVISFSIGSDTYELTLSKKRAPKK